MERNDRTSDDTEQAAARNLSFFIPCGQRAIKSTSFDPQTSIRFSASLKKNTHIVPPFLPLFLPLQSFHISDSVSGIKVR